MNNVMLDLETAGNGSHAAIVSIGAVFFDPLTGQIGSEFYWPVDLDDAAKYGQMDASTIAWWMKQPYDARAVFNAKDKLILHDALLEFADWICQIEGFKNRMVWGNGATFDNVILANAYAATKLTRPWPYFGDRDVRTVVDIGRRVFGMDPKKTMALTGTAHNALDDAKHQAAYVSAIYQRLAQQVAA
ncbi:exodeoxyribonuclease VIII [Neiella marina]|uniref:Exodeoxyribonuclease VIII n=1 Tax=Neiella marina TaxID=508461 RepID=A0A8J2U605_9GAMM|nr:3'-5' exonuclease [Neiella marina]GGA80596.1 exodeoxyribonuclease VIII [Neiella marina]